MTFSLSGKYIFNASENQERLWFLHSYDKNAGAAYNIAVAYQITGEINRIYLQKAYNLILERHEALRTALIRKNGELQQAIEPSLKLTLNYEDISSRTDHEEIDIILKDKLRSNAIRYFELSKPGLIRAVLYRVKSDKYCLLLAAHHSICDGNSIQIISNELFKAYDDICNNKPFSLSPIEYQYADYVEWFKKWTGSKEYSKDIDYWKNLLDGETYPATIKTVPTSIEKNQFIGSIKKFKFTNDLGIKIKKFCNNYLVTKYSFMLSLYAYLIYTYSKSNDFLIGIPVENRTLPEFDSTVGYFANTLVMRIKIQPELSILEFIKSNSLQISQNLSHQKIEFSKLVDILNPPASNQPGDVFRMLFGYQEIQSIIESKHCRKITSEHIDIGLSKFDCSFYIFETQEDISCVVEHNSGISDNQINDFFEKYRHLAKYFLDNPNSKLSEINLVKMDKHYRLSGPKAKIHNILELISTSASLNPNKIAIFCEDKAITYRELDSLSSAIANELLNEKGLKQGDVVGIYLPRSINLVLAIIGLAKAGIVYVPFTCNMPLERKKYMAKDANLKYFISSFQMKGIPENIQLLDIEHLKSCSRPFKTINIDDKSLGYINYTSGTTGSPKGVLVKWLGINNLLSHFINEKIINENDKFLAVSSVAFDISVLELLLPLACGAYLHIATEEEVKDNQRIIQLIKDNYITMMQATPSFWGMLFERDWAPMNGFKSLVGGEPFPLSMQERFFDNHSKVFNLYGPTETTIWSSIKEITMNNNITIGTPVQNTVIYIANDYLTPLPQYSLGEIVIEGAGVSSGYNNNRELTDSKFFCERSYKTGDLGRIINGEVHYEGRSDNQIKLRGYRIELSEIESIITRHPRVSRAIALLKNDKKDARKIIAFVKTKDTKDNEGIVEEIKNFCLDYLVDYEKPSDIIIVENIPSNINGKIDSKKLFELYDTIAFNTNIILSSTQTELKVEAIWQSILEYKSSIDIHINFFDLGGNSLLIAKLVETINREFKISIGMRLAFTNPTIESLSKNIDKILSEQSVLTQKNDLPSLNIEDLIHEIA